MNKSFDYSNQIEALLKQVWPDVPLWSEISKDPFGNISAVLEYLNLERIQCEQIRYFRKGYQAIEGKSMDELLDVYQDGQSTVQEMISDLDKLVRKAIEERKKLDQEQTGDKE
jgi:hypothetical protein